MSNADIKDFLRRVWDSEASEHDDVHDMLASISRLFPSAPAPQARPRLRRAALEEQKVFRLRLDIERAKPPI